MTEADTKGILAAVQHLADELNAKFEKQDERFDKRFDQLEKKLSELDDRQSRRFTEIESKLDRQDRRIAAIESFPIPTTRPGTYHAATEVNSVSRPVRRKQSHYG